MSAGTRERAAVCGALVVAVGALLGSLTQTWVEVSAARAAPLPELAEDIGGRSLAPALGGAGLVALAGAVAVLATSGWARRAVGALLAITGAAGALGAVRLAGGPSEGRARELLADRSSGVGFGADTPVEVAAHALWPLAAAACCALIAAAGVATALRGPSWSAMSSRYDAPDRRGGRTHAAGAGDARSGGAGDGGAAGYPAGAGDPKEGGASLALWNSLDRGVDPTADPSEPSQPSADASAAADPKPR